MQGTPTTGGETRANGIGRNTAFEDLPEFLTVAELARVMNCGRAAAYEYGRVHGQRFGRLIRIRKGALLSK